MKPKQIILLVLSLGLVAVVMGGIFLFVISRISGYAFLDHGRQAYKKKDYVMALTCFDWSLKLLPENAKIYVDRAFVYRALGKSDLAASDFNEAIRLNPKDDIAIDELGQIHLRQKNYAQAIKEFSQSIAINPNSKWAYTHRGQAYRQTHQDELALDDLNKAVIFSPELSLGWLTRSEVYLDQHEYRKAIGDLDKVIELTPNPALIYGIRGTTYLRLHDEDHALADFDKAIELGTTWDGTYASRARLFRKRGEHNRAQEDFSAALNLNPKNGRTYVDRAMDYIATNQFSQALGDCQQALQISPHDDWVCNEVAWIFAVSPHAEMRDGKRAVELALDSCQLTAWKKPNPVDTLAAAYAESGDFTKAVNWEYYYLQIAEDAPSRASGEGRLHLYQQHMPCRTDQY